MVFNNGKADIHSAEQFHSLRSSGSLITRQLAEIAVHKADQGKSAKSYDFPCIFTDEGKVVFEWLAHGYGITRTPCVRKPLKRTVPLFLAESGTGKNAVPTPYTPAGTAAGAAGAAGAAAGTSG